MNAVQNTKSMNNSSSVKVWIEPKLSVVPARDAQLIDSVGTPVGFNSKS